MMARGIFHDNANEKAGIHGMMSEFFIFYTNYVNRTMTHSKGHTALVFGANRASLSPMLVVQEIFHADISACLLES